MKFLTLLFFIAGLANSMDLKPMMPIILNPDLHVEYFDISQDKKIKDNMIIIRNTSKLSIDEIKRMLLKQELGHHCQIISSTNKGERKFQVYKIEDDSIIVNSNRKSAFILPRDVFFGHVYEQLVIRWDKWTALQFAGEGSGVSPK